MPAPDMSAFAMTPVQMDADQLAEHHRRIAEKNEERARDKIAAANRAAGRPKPKLGDTLFVSPARGIRARGRAGLRFDEATRTQVVVCKPGDDPPKGALATTIDGAEQIIADDSLVVFSTSASAEDAAKLREQLDASEAALQSANEELRRLKAEARRNAKDPGDGRPSRLPAAAAVTAADKKDSGGLEP